MEDQKLIKLRNSFVKKKLRKASLSWPPRNEAAKRARKQRGKYECAGCKSLFEYKKLKKDHIDPVASLQGEAKQENGEMDWNIYIPRLLTQTENWQLLCEICHDVKTLVENDIRKRQKKRPVSKRNKSK